MAESERGRAREWTHLHYLEVLDRLHGVIRRADDLEHMLADVQDLLLDVFSCDRAWLLYPCDPASPVFRVPMERTRPAWPGAHEFGHDVPLDDETRDSFAAALANDGPLHFDSPADGLTLKGDVFETFHIRAQMTVALYPEVDRPWLLGVHFCREAHAFSDAEVRLFDGVGRRVSDALSTLLTLRDLRRSENRSRALVEFAPEAILLLDTESGCFVEANRKASTLFGLSREQLLEIGFSGLDAAVDELQAGIQAALAGEQIDLEWSFQAPDRGTVPCEVRLSAFPTDEGALIRCSVMDITDRKRKEAQRQQSQKLEVVGLLAGGVAHDFNNLLTVIGGRAELLLRRGDVAPEAVQPIIVAAEQAAALTHHLLSFSRGAVSQPRVVDLNAVLSASLPLLQRLIGERHELTFKPKLQLGGTLIDPSQVQQIVMNLVVNARDAMPEGGKISLETEAHESPSQLTGPCVGISVRDRGVGMEAIVRARIFEPFFTTKPLGQGTGLGLSTILDIVRARGGAVEVESEPGRGSRISVYLPACESDGVLEPADSERSAPKGGRGEQLLLVEDEERVRRLCATVLEGAGYRVLALSCGAEALEVCEARGDAFELLLTDAVMPGLSGCELAKRLMGRFSSLKVLCLSGYAPDEDLKLAVKEGLVEFLAKPFSPEALLRKVRELLDRGSRLLP